MTKIKNQMTIGQRFGRGVVVELLRLPGQTRIRAGRTRTYTQRGAGLLCDCGNYYTAPASALFTANTRSCGCLSRELSSVRGKANAKHGMHRHPLYDTWNTMMRRCYLPANRKYPRYGGRGITVCPEWHDARVFIAWIEANLGTRPDGMTLDRRDNDGNYEPGNVRWATPLEQAANRSSTSQHPGITWVPRLSKWRVQVSKRYVGVFESFDEAQVVLADRRAAVAFAREAS